VAGGWWLVAGGWWLVDWWNAELLLSLTESATRSTTRYSLLDTRHARPTDPDPADPLNDKKPLCAGAGAGAERRGGVLCNSRPINLGVRRGLKSRRRADKLDDVDFIAEQLRLDAGV
jgi:hypothetical protein